MAKLQVERIGGLPGFGGARSHLRSRGEVELSDLSAADQQAVESLFQLPDKPRPSQMRDGFQYRITRNTAKGIETIVVPEEALPSTLRGCVKDEIV
jgi:hypothetical protein